MTEQFPEPLTPAQQFWHEHILACRDSGLSARAYAEHQQLDVRQLYAWTAKLRKRGILSSGRPGRFQKLAVPQTTLEPHGRCRLRLPNGIVVELDGPVDTSWLSTVLHVAGQAR